MTLARRLPQTTEAGDGMVAPLVLSALDCLRVAITVFDAAEQLVFANEHFSHMFRSLPPRQNLIGCHYADLIRLEVAGGEIAASDDLADIDAYVDRRLSQLIDGEYHPRDIPLSDGRIIEIKARRAADGGWIVLWTDVTAARHTLARLRTAISMSADAFAFYSPRDTLMLCNDEYAALNGAERSEDLLGLPFSQLAAELARRGRIVMPEGPHVWLTKRLEVHRAAAGAMTVEMASGEAYLLRDRATHEGGRVVVFTDITEHHRVEKALLEQTRTLDTTRHELARSQAESSRQATYLADLATKLDRAASEAATTKTTLLRTMSHELKTPLNAIIGFSDLLLSLGDRAAPEQVADYAAMIHSGGKNLLRLINHILDLTKISAGRYELRLQELDIGAQMWAAKEAFAARAAGKNIAIDADGCPVGIVARADEAAFTAMVGHLIDNAVTFTQDGGQVRLAVTKLPGSVRVVVRDNGPGVAPADIERILLPFEQGGRGTADHAAGAGLGLTLVKAFSELHGGRLAVESTPGKGFVATITLPAAAN